MGISTQVECQKIHYQVQGNVLLHNISCQFDAAKISVILGKNGAGKSTLLNLLSKELLATKGRVIWQNRPLDNLSYADLAQQRAVLPQLQAPAFSISVQELVELGAHVQQEINSQQIHSIVQTVMQACDVIDLAQRDVMKLSGGEQKRAHLARVLAQIWPVLALDTGLPNPFLGRWLLLDEWTNNLDLHHQQALAKLFTQWATQGLGIVMVLHDINLCAQMADQVTLLKQGRLFSQGRVDEVLNPIAIEQALDFKVQIVNIENIKHPVILPKVV